MSRSALERLGKQLVATDSPNRADIGQLHMLLSAYGPVLTSSVELVSAGIGSVPSSRVKTTGTLIEKLRRSGGHTLSSIHDLGGMRIVVAGDRAAQDRMVAQISEIFADGAREPRVIDRRIAPIQGYRAVHVIIYPDGFPIEVQVRTQWQHLWAEWFERLADQYGRGIRYGEPPSAGGPPAERMIRQVIELADQISAAEEDGTSPPASAVVLALIDAALGWLRDRPSNP